MSTYLHEGGTPITPELATELRHIIFGSAAIPIRADWLHTPFKFNAPKEDLGYGLQSPRNATRGLLSVVQGFIIKNLLFESTTTKSFAIRDPMRPPAEIQYAALIAAMVDILRIICDKGKVIIGLPSPSDEIFVPHSVNYFHDSVTEKLYLFTMSPNDTEQFLRRHLQHFIEVDGPGTLLFLYSAVLTRSLSKVRSDVDPTKVVPLTLPTHEEGSLVIVMLLLTGRAVPHIFNGVVNIQNDNSFAVEQYGVLKRATIGLLLEQDGFTPGSRLKTPNYPIWITYSVGHYGVLFNTNPELLRNYHAESCFDVYYYSCSGHQLIVTIDNRSCNAQASGMLIRRNSDNAPMAVCKSCDENQTSSRLYTGTASASSDASQRDESAQMSTPILRLIHTKWEEAQIRCSAQSSSLSYLFNTNH